MIENVRSIAIQIIPLILAKTRWIAAAYSDRSVPRQAKRRRPAIHLRPVKGLAGHKACATIFFG
jgi:hypothetical protein